METEEKRQAILEAFKQGVSIKRIDSSHRVKKESIEAGTASKADIERIYAKLCSLQEQSREQRSEQREQSREQSEKESMIRLQEENERLKEENARLREENERLKAKEKATMEQREQAIEQSSEQREQAIEQSAMQTIAAKLEVIEQRLNKMEQAREQSQSEQAREQSKQGRVFGFKLSETTTTTNGKKYRKCYAVRGKAKVYLGGDFSQAESKIKAYCQSKEIGLS